MREQRRLDGVSVEAIKVACESIFRGFPWADTPEGDAYWCGIYERLKAMVEHGTSDGKPWVGPKVEIPEGYRLAKPEEHVREDVMFRFEGASYWTERSWKGEFDPPELGTTYIVPIDAVPPKGTKEPSREELGAELERFRSDFDEVVGLLKDDTASKGYRIAAAFSLPVIQGKIDELKAKIEKMDLDRELTDEDACVWPRRLVMVRDRDSGPWQGPVHFVAKTNCELCFVTEHNRRGVVCWRYARPATPEEIKEAGL